MSMVVQLASTREWVQTVGISAGVLITAASTAVAALEYRLKARAERAESDTKLARLFADLVPIADGYTAAELPDGLAAAMIDSDMLVRADFEPDTGARRQSPAGNMLEAAMVTAPVGRATMVSTLRAIAELGANHKLLHGPATEALSGLVHHRSSDPMRAAYDRSDAVLKNAHRQK